MAKKQYPPVEEIAQALRYEPETGKLYWREGRPRLSPHGRYGTGEALRQSLPSGYLQGSCAGHRLYAHRVAWALHYGRWPNGEVDHVNGVRDDNRIVNLREATPSQNQANRPAKGGASKYRGVISSISKANPWCAQIRRRGKGYHLGQFATEEEAARAYDDAARKHYGEFARLNFPDMTTAA